jgi:hypothetical protein
MVISDVNFAIDPFVEKFSQQIGNIDTTPVLMLGKPAQ